MARFRRTYLAPSKPNINLNTNLFVSVNKLTKNNYELICSAGNFIFLSDSPAINMRNIPKDKEYFALLIEFDYQDFNGLQMSTPNKQQYFIGETASILEKCLLQFVESSIWVPKQLLSLRKREIIEIPCHMGHKEILTMMGNSKIGQRLHDIFCQQNFNELTFENICIQLAMSESSLLRKLKLEGTSDPVIKD
jgi:hypothetical protein